MIVERIRGRRIPTCFECGEECEQTGRMTWYCPDCDVCPECGCPDADGFKHYEGCAASDQEVANHGD